MPVISITTDFGEKDGFVGTMKGVIGKICPEAQIADITHEVPPQDILTGAIALWRAAPFFPPGSVHIAVVDPGVGTLRRPMAAQLGQQYVVGPDNGLFTPLIMDAERAGQTVHCVQLDNPEYWLPAVSRTFHGRDIFAPVGAYLACGVPLETLGTRFDDPVRLVLPQAERNAQGWRAHISVIDVFGNLTTDLPGAALEGRRDVTIQLCGRQVEGIVDSYGHRQAGELVALVDSEGFLEVAVVNGSAAKLLGAKLGEVVEVIFGDDEADR
jgi:S-adenosylmethionine hydrolase